MAKILDVERSNEAHQAGSNSLLTVDVFSKMNTILRFVAGMSQGCLYGITLTIVRAPLVVIHMPSSWASPQRYWQPLQAHVVIAPMILHRRPYFHVAYSPHVLISALSAYDFSLEMSAVCLVS